MWGPSEVSVKEVTSMRSEGWVSDEQRINWGRGFPREETEMLKARVWERFCSMHRNFKEFN